MSAKRNTTQKDSNGFAISRKSSAPSGDATGAKGAGAAKLIGRKSSEPEKVTREMRELRVATEKRPTEAPLMSSPPSAASSSPSTLIPTAENLGDSGRSPSKSNQFPLHRAVKEGNVKLMQELFEQGADVNAPNPFGVTPLHLSCSQGSVECTELLLAQPNIDVNFKDRIEERTALHFAAKHSQVRMLALLLAKGAKIDVKCREGQTPLMKACESLECTQLLLRHSAAESPSYVNIAESVFNETALHMCANRGSEQTLRLLLAHGAKPNAKNVEGNTPLHLAVNAEHLGCVDALLQFDADPEIENNEQKNPIQLAAKSNQIAELLSAALKSKRLAKLREKDVSQWNNGDLIAWFRAEGPPLDQYISLLQANSKFDGKALEIATSESLRLGLGLKSLAHRKELLDRLNEFKEKARSLLAATNETNEPNPSAPKGNANGSRVAEFQVIDFRHLKVRPEVLGKGHFGEVKRATWNSREVALKIIYRQNFRSQSEYELFRKEVQIMSRVSQHPNIISFLGVTSTPEGHAGIITRYMSRGNLYMLVHHNFGLLQQVEGLREKIVLDICAGMSHLHEQKPQPIIHRDLNSRNVLLDDDLTAVVADLGLSRFQQDDGKMSTAVGCLPWVAPEVFRGDAYNEKADVYSFGMLLFEVCTAREPHDTAGPAQQEVPAIRFATMCAYANYRPSIPGGVAPLWAQLMRSCWDADARKRPSFPAIANEIRSNCKYVTPQFDRSKEKLLTLSGGASASTTPVAAAASALGIDMSKEPVYINN